ncbi:MAG: sulfite oxidase [SAR202 cluster bacterium]|nr:sulfite oxidase [SAR202 cluster bacterium]
MTARAQNLVEGAGLVPVSEDPFCREARLGTLDSLITPTERFYIRNHFHEVPDIDPRDYRLTIDGLVRKPLSLSLDDLTAMPSTDLVVTLECAGNSRSFITPPAEGLAFKHGAISTAQWRGVSLASVLNNAGLKDGIKEVVFHGADHGEEEEHGRKLDIDYGRSLPLEIALDPNIILAYEMNGQPLTPGHGFPLRLVVPGWFGMASVKWLTNIHPTDEPYHGFFQKRRYVYINEGTENVAERQPVSALKVKSLITHPRHGEVIQPGPYTVRGFAWSGAGEVAKLDVSVNGGKSWRKAKLERAANSGAWQPWELPWQATDPGHYVFMARATDSAGNVQPRTVPWNFRGYANNAIHTIAIEVPFT